MKRERLILVLFALFFLLLFLREIVVGFATDWWWFSAVEYEGVFLKALGSRIVLFFTFGGIFMAFFYANLHWATRRGGGRWKEFYSELNVPTEVLERFRKVLIVVVSLLVALALGAWASDEWMTVLQFLNAGTFGTPDPIFGKDVGFFLFKLPLLEFARSWALWTLAVTAVAVLLIYWESKALGWAYEKLYISPRVRLHLIFLASVLFLLLAWHFQLEIYDLLYSGRGVVFGASFTDVNAELIAYRVMMGLSVVLFGAMVYGLWRKNVQIPLYAAGGYVALLIVVTGLYPAAIQQFIVEPNEVTKERPYIEHAIEYTRLGYGLDDVQEEDFTTELTLGPESLDEYSGTFTNIRLWDWRPLRQTYSQLQELRLYYRFLSPDVDRYHVQGDYRQVLLAPRELDVNQLPQQARTWINQYIKYTHGYGLTMSPVNEVTSEGMPVLFIRDIPPRSDHGFEITRPEIYYGELTHDYVLTGTTEDEFDYASGERNETTRYEGTGGVPIGNLLRRTVYALKYGHFKLLISEYPTSETRLMENRRIANRTFKIAPFLRYDNDAYMVISEGRLYWILDAYTVSDRMPYSEPGRDGINYIRNSVKVVIDAYNGDVTYYLVEPDPITDVLGSIFPGLFTDYGEMPEGIRDHIRYPLDLFHRQAEKWRLFHMEDPEVFYNQEDLWALPSEVYQGSQIPMEPYYVILELEEDRGEEFLLMLPYTPQGRDNMIGWLAARSDPGVYGQLKLFKFSKQELIYGPMQIEARIDQDPTISEQTTLWSQQGSQVIRGNLLVIPVGRNLVYAEPLYLKADRSELPELKRVILSYGPRVVMAKSLEQGLEVLLGKESAAALPGVTVTQMEPTGEQTLEMATPEGVVRVPSEQASRALQLYQQAQEHLRGGRWAEYGESMQELEQILQKLQEQLGGGGG
ncbi:MAG: UPF0182 family protein [bacterium]